MGNPTPSSTHKAGLSEAELSLIGSGDHRVTWIERGRQICSAPTRVHVLLDGWAFKYRLLANGRRQILGLYLSGDVCDLDRLLFPNVQFGVQAANKCRVAEMPLETLKNAVNENQPLRDLFWSMTVLENVAMTELVTSLGSRTARERTAWLLCDLIERLQSRRQITDERFDLELTQSDMADLLGLSLVHMNRSLKGLKAEGMIDYRGSTYSILDLVKLRAVAATSTVAQRTASNLGRAIFS